MTCVDRRNSQPVPTDFVRFMIMGTLTLLGKQVNAPDICTINNALQMMQSEHEMRRRTA